MHRHIARGPVPRRAAAAAVALLGAVLPMQAAAADAIDGRSLGLAWAIPFVGLLLSIALLPLVAPRWWHRHDGKLTLAWALAFLLPFALLRGAGEAGAALVHAALAEYLPFVVLLVALFTVAGGIHIRGQARGGPGFNCGLMAIGALLASVMGTTGASVLLIRPLVRANEQRRHVAHVVVFFIFIVGNVGGALTPLGDPPLFLGFLRGVDFFWTARAIGGQTLCLVAVLLAVFYFIDRRFCAKEGVRRGAPTPDAPAIAIDGKVNLVLLVAIAALVLLSGSWKPGMALELAGTTVGLPQLLRDAALVGITLLSLRLTPASAHAGNQFSWAPMREVARLFAGIFVTIAPVLAMLAAGRAGAFAPVVALVSGGDGQPVPAAYFWATGLLSAFLDNAPTYLVFFNLAGGDAQQLMTTLAPVLAAISAGSVFMGALSYIGNAPNLMVKAIAEDRGIAMPGFFGYMAWSAAVLLPLFALMTLIWLH